MAIPLVVEARFTLLRATPGMIPNMHVFEALHQYTDQQSFSDEAAFNAAMGRLTNNDPSEVAAFSPVFAQVMNRNPNFLDMLVVKQIISQL